MSKLSLNAILAIVKQYQDTDTGKKIYDQIMVYRNSKTISNQTGGMKFEFSDGEKIISVEKEAGKANIADVSGFIEILAEDSNEEGIPVPFTTESFEHMIKFFDLSKDLPVRNGMYLEDTYGPLRQPTTERFFARDLPILNFLESLTKDQIKGLYKISKYFLYQECFDYVCAKIGINIIPELIRNRDKTKLANFLDKEIKAEAGKEDDSEKGKTKTTDSKDDDSEDDDTESED